MPKDTRTVLLAVCLSLCLLPAVQAAALQTGDGVRVEVSDGGRVTGLRVGEVALPMRGSGGFALADFKRQPEPANLVPNPSFEEGTRNWRFAPGQALDTAVARTGKASARIAVAEPASSSLDVVVPVKPNTRYRVGMWLRREKVGVCGVYSSERDDQNRLSGKLTQTGVSIPKEDGVWHPLTWEITTEPKTTRLSLRGDIYRSTGTLWLDDFFVHEMTEGVFDPVPGRLTLSGGNATFAGSMPERGLALEATLRADADCLRVDGVVRDTTGEDRAVGVRFALPLDLAGWNWHTDAEEKEAITAGPPHRATYNCVSGIGVCSIYPWSAMSGDAAGLSLALPLSQGPRVFVIQHDQRVPETSITFYFGLAKDAAENPSRAPFSFVLYRHDPAWGMRSAMARYYRLFPESFVKRPTFEGYLNYADMERFDPKTHRLVMRPDSLEDASDFGEGYKFLWHVHGCYDYRQVPHDDPKRPDDGQVFALLGKMVDAEKSKPKWYTPTEETMKKIVFGPAGGISYIGDTRYWRPHEGYNHTDQPGWGLNFRVNEDPGVSPFLAEMSRRKAEEYAKTPHRPWDGTFTADAIEGYMANQACINYRREHFKTTLAPLTFGKGNLLPAMPNTIWDFQHKVWQPLTSEHKIATYGNANCYEQFFTMPYVDVPMTEGNWDPQHDGRLDRFMRAVNYRKIWRYWHAWDMSGGYAGQDPARVRAHLRRGLAYAIYPSVACVQGAGGDLEGYRALYRQYVPAMEELSVAGWEPVPYATAGEGVVVERYGGYAAGELHFTLRNYGDQPVETLLTLDRKALGIPAGAELLVLDILPRSAQFSVLSAPSAPQRSASSVKVQLDADGTRALWIGTRQQAAQHGFRLAAATLEKLERLFYTEMDPAGRADWENALKIAREGAGAAGLRALALAEELQQSVAHLEKSLRTNAPADLAKLLYRVRVEASFAPAALLSFESESRRVLENCLRGETTPALWKVSAGGPLSQVRAAVLSPWAETAAQCRVAAPAAGRAFEVAAQLSIPANPPRRLMPYLLTLAGTSGKTPFTLAMPVDLVVGTPLGVTALPERVFRGQERRLTFKVANRLPDVARVTVNLQTPAGVKLDPARFALDLAGGATAEQAVLATFAQSVAIGGLRLNWSTTAENARFDTQGCLDFNVSDPVPQVPIRRAGTPPTIDGNLADALWQEAPTIPELRILANAGPATEKTAVWAAYDDRGLYVAFRCLDSQMSKLVAKLTERGSPLYQDDDVEVFLSVPGGAQVYQFAVNANGAFSDNSGNKSPWRAAAQRSEAGWTVEIFVPYSILGLSVPPPAGACWGMQFGRQQKSKAETTSWTPGQAFIAKEGFGEVVFR